MIKKTEKERMLAGELYNPKDESLKKIYREGQEFRYQFSRTNPNDKEKLKQLIHSAFGGVGKNVDILPLISVDYGSNIYVGDNFYANYDCIFLDVCRIDIGNDVMFGPRVAIYTADHPIDGEYRSSGLESGRSVTIGNNVWIGGSAVINPGVNIGNNVVIGSGSVVTKDIPDNVVAAGNPARVLRKVNEQDKINFELMLAKYRES